MSAVAKILPLGFAIVCGIAGGETGKKETKTPVSLFVSLVTKLTLTGVYTFQPMFEEAAKKQQADARKLSPPPTQPIAEAQKTIDNKDGGGSS
ncbi:hypothetical protein GMORB2_2450 [Geosmithia morbida]|uniref:Uncharacterized protein n=1 Tax=Geosmithia morbida TaxID=1094350 RepID=A0A9P5D3Y6_9HYPO|nr:uncharacterized protein GMORB2_2450 [Geosmithia morbida]KAF4120964.1 hypothetical protein GMORB2_2450 [Geosmithia morbida]